MGEPRVLPDLSALMARLEALEADNARLRTAATGKVVSFERSENNPKYYVFKSGLKGYPTSATAEQWRAILANSKLIEAGLA